MQGNVHPFMESDSSCNHDTGADQPCYCTIFPKAVAFCPKSSRLLFILGNQVFLGGKGSNFKDACIWTCIVTNQKFFVEEVAQDLDQMPIVKRETKHTKEHSVWNGLANSFFPSNFTFMQPVCAIWNKQHFASLTTRSRSIHHNLPTMIFH